MNKAARPKDQHKRIKDFLAEAQQQVAIPPDLLEEMRRQWRVAVDRDPISQRWRLRRS
jgi:hypothetical protein